MRSKSSSVVYKAHMYTSFPNVFENTTSPIFHSPGGISTLISIPHSLTGNMRSVIITAVVSVFCTCVHSLTIGQRSPQTSDDLLAVNQPSPLASVQTSASVNLELCNAQQVGSFPGKEVSFDPMRTAVSDLFCFETILISLLISHVHL